jgi:hypothetical protein
MRQFFGAIFLKFKRLASIFLLMIKPYDISSYDKIIKKQSRNNLLLLTVLPQINTIQVDTPIF